MALFSAMVSPPVPTKFEWIACACAWLMACARAVEPAPGGANSGGDAAVVLSLDASGVDGGAAGLGGVPVGLPIGGLTPAQTAQWCTWLAGVEHAANPGTTPFATGPDSRGYRHFSGGASCWSRGPSPAFDVGTPLIGVDDCVANVRVSGCAAPVGNVEACMHASWMDPDCDAASVHACDALAANPTCHDLLLDEPANPSTFEDMTLRVE